MAVSRATPWRWISGLFGVMCLLLATILATLLKMSFFKESFMPTTSPVPTTEFQEDSECCLCQERWIGYRCNCFFISKQWKTIQESRDICASKNSFLLQLHSGDELNFMKYNDQFYWVGIMYSKDHGAWLWDNGSAISKDIYKNISSKNSSKCIQYSPQYGFIDEQCHKKFTFICMQRLI